MSQIFGNAQVEMMNNGSSLWISAGFLEDVDAHERALGEAGFEHGNVPVHMNREGFHPRGDVWGQHLRSDRAHHTWAIARVQNPEIDPNARQLDVGGAKPRYAVEIHSVPDAKNTRGAGSVTRIWEGNDIRNFLTGKRRDGGMTWPDVQRAMSSGPRR